MKYFLIGDGDPARNIHGVIIQYFIETDDTPNWEQRIRTWLNRHILAPITLHEITPEEYALYQPDDTAIIWHAYADRLVVANVPCEWCGYRIYGNIILGWSLRFLCPRCIANHLVYCDNCGTLFEAMGDHSLCADCRDREDSNEENEGNDWFNIPVSEKDISNLMTLIKGNIKGSRQGGYWITTNHHDDIISDWRMRFPCPIHIYGLKNKHGVDISLPSGWANEPMGTQFQKLLGRRYVIEFTERPFRIGLSLWIRQMEGIKVMDIIRKCVI